MKINDIISEGSVYGKHLKIDELEIAKAVELLNKHCRESLALIEWPIWRGMSPKGKIVSIDPRKAQRESRNTSNHYTELIDNSPYFKGWPKRSKSLICSTSKAKATMYSYYEGLYAIFPFDGAKIAVCPYGDIWQTNFAFPKFDLSFGTGGRDGQLVKFNRWLNDLCMPDNYEAMVLVTTEERHPFHKEFVRRFKQEKPDNLKPEKFIPYLMQCMAPENSGFRLLTIQEFANINFVENEVWTDSPVIAIRSDLWGNFKDAFGKQNASI